MSLIRERLNEERGSILPLVAVVLLLLLGLAAFSIDIAKYQGAQRSLQAAADAAALAGAQDLPTDPATAVTDAQDYMNANTHGATATITTPYNSDTSTIKVVVTRTDPGVFGGVWGIGSATLSASAVARLNPEAATTAFFAADTTCADDTLDITANNTLITGGIHSNGAGHQPGNNNTFGDTSYGGPNNCSWSATGANNHYAGGPTPDPKTEPWPIDYSQNPPACTYSATSFTWTKNNSTIPSGVYCATGTIDVKGNQICGNVTFIATTIVFSGNSNNGGGCTLTPYADGLLAYQTGTSPLDVIGNNISGGTIFAPNARVVMTGNNGTGSGYIEALDITVAGNNWNFTGTGPPVDGIASVELTG
jgi:Flp pilus assembly protein TadG